MLFLKYIKNKKHIKNILIKENLMKKFMIITILLVLLLMFMLFYFKTITQVAKKIELTTNNDQKVAGSITSNSFNAGGPINKKYTCDGANTSPELSWHFDTPDAIKSYVLLVDDPDAQPVVGHTVTHWGLLMPPSVTQLPAHISGKDQAPITTFNQDIKPLNTTYKTDYYQGPCPPPTSEAHTYNFTVFALNMSVEQIYQIIQGKTYTAQEFKNDMDEHILANVVLQGTYRRQ